ncbi:hypothetical protein [Thiothrix litoralis]|jgi:drug/metabolite transporter (DMT)-like permease|uniref:hypothetical protein n=1 Tax=Thiothrix litoralis TaxID=2891210 RepID=UPI003C743E2A
MVLPALFVLLWSTGFIGAKYRLPYADPLAFMVARYVLVIVALSLTEQGKNGDYFSSNC